MLLLLLLLLSLLLSLLSLSDIRNNLREIWRSDTRCLLCRWWVCNVLITHDGVLSWWRHQMETFPRYWPFVRGIHRPPVNSPHKGQWRGALMFCLICAWINGWVSNDKAGDLRRHRAHYDVTMMCMDHLPHTRPPKPIRYTTTISIPWSSSRQTS